MFLFKRDSLAPLLIAVGFSSVCHADGDEHFNTSFLQGAAASVDLQSLLASSSVLPGNYRVDLYGNDTLVGRRDIDFRRNPSNGRVEACLTLEMLQQVGVDIGALQANGKLVDTDPNACLDLPALIEHASVRYDVPRLRLLVSVPLPFGAVAVPMSLIDTSPMLTEIVLFSPMPSTEQASLLMLPVKLMVPLPALVGVAGGSAANALPAAKIDNARSVRDSCFMLFFPCWG
jgi:hypothetical protein